MRLPYYKVKPPWAEQEMIMTEWKYNEDASGLCEVCGCVKLLDDDGICEKCFIPKEDMSEDDTSDLDYESKRDDGLF